MNLRIVKNNAADLEDLVKQGDVGHLLNVETDVTVKRRNPLQLTRL
jgi:hypothetical protein